MGLLLAVALTSARPPDPKPTTAPANEFSAGRALALAEELLGDVEPHPIGSAANAEVRDVITGELSRLGYDVETQETLGCRVVWATCGYVENVLARLPGEGDGKAVLLSAHYDSVPAGPGAADDIAGVAAILEIARILQQEGPYPNPIIILISDGEEPGLLGAEAFVAEHPWAAEVGVVVNLEASGTSGPSALFETTDDNAWLLAAYESSAPRPVANSLFDELMAFSTQHTDLNVYEENGLPAVNFAFVDRFTHYHTPLDNLENLDPASVQHHGDNALASVRTFATIDLIDPPAGSSLVVDALPGVLLTWPESWAIWLALAGLVVLGVVAAVLIRSGDLTPRRLLWGQPVLPLTLILSAAAGMGWATGLGLLTDAPVPWYASPLAMRVAVWIGALLILVLMVTLVGRRAGPWGLSVGIWTWWAVLAALAGWLAPGFSVLLLPPALLGILALAVVALSPLRAWPGAIEIATLVGLAGSSWFLLPFAIGIEETQGGSELAALIAFAVALAASPSAPLIAVPARYLPYRRRAVATAAVAIAVATIVLMLTPVYSAERPQRLNLLHVDDRHLGEARWLIEPDQPAGLVTPGAPDSLFDTAPFAETPAPAFAWSGRQYFAAPAPASDAPAPTIEVLADERRDSERVVSLRLHSPRDADRLSLYVPEAAALLRIAVPGSPYVVSDPDPQRGFHEFFCHAPACDGLDVELHLASDEAIELYVVDWSPGLPPSGDELLAARPETAVPSQDGDGTIILDRVVLVAI